MDPGPDTGITLLDALEAGAGPGLAGQAALLQGAQALGDGEHGRGACSRPSRRDGTGADSHIVHWACPVLDLRVGARRAGAMAPADVDVTHLLVGEQIGAGVGQDDAP